ncbi:tripartite motif-containing protein 10-like [Sceloporus undulatus]|uniref:tripartite motif-containing protein 10-like n=1 Tax=Sceloporus undulatus TaxID=8520 RepID=UPI001C4CE8F2|nr:tripartite motif-containing protein 10-like [Sceloporus undulatus]
MSWVSRSHFTNLFFSLLPHFTISLQKGVKAKREKIVLEFQQLRLFLEEQERHLLAQLGELEKDMAKEQKETVRLNHTFSLLSSLISDLEKDCQRPAGEFLLNLKKTFTRNIGNRIKD